MKKQWLKFKAWSKRTWLRFKVWFAGILVAVGLISVGSVQPIELTYTRATFYTDGTVLPLEEIAETRLYCNGQLITSEPGADGAFSDVQNLLPVGVSECYATHVATNATESGPSGVATVVVMTSAAPNPPDNFSQ